MATWHSSGIMPPKSVSFIIFHGFHVPVNSKVLQKISTVWRWTWIWSSSLWLSLTQQLDCCKCQQSIQCLLWAGAAVTDVEDIKQGLDWGGFYLGSKGNKFSQWWPMVDVSRVILRRYNQVQQEFWGEEKDATLAERLGKILFPF
jgi:hypothetical protein